MEPERTTSLIDTALGRVLLLRTAERLQGFQEPEIDAAFERWHATQGGDEDEFVRLVAARWDERVREFPALAELEVPVRRNAPGLARILLESARHGTKGPRELSAEEVQLLERVGEKLRKRGFQIDPDDLRQLWRQAERDAALEI